MAEALLNQLGKGRFRAYSAGSHPSGIVNPIAIETLQKSRINTDGLHSKSWNDFAAPDAPKMDLVFTVCDSTVREKCPSWPGHPMYAYWGISDPSTITGSDEAIRKAFLETLMTLRRRIELLITLPAEKLESLAVSERVKGSGQVLA